MRLKLSENPKEWRKTAWLSALGAAILCTVLHWRHVLHNESWTIALLVAAAIVLCAWVSPGLFRGYYRASTWLGYCLSLIGGRVALTIFFILFLTPLGLLLRLTGKDLLKLKRHENAKSYWNPRNEKRPLDRLF